MTEELAGWRRRTLRAEAELAEAAASGGEVAGPELKEARQRIDRAGERRTRRCGSRIEAAQVSGSRCSRPGSRSWSSTEEGTPHDRTKNAVRVTIGGEEYTVRSELPAGVHPRGGGLLRRGAQAGARLAAHGGDPQGGHSRRPRDHRRAVPGPPRRPRDRRPHCRRWPTIWPGCSRRRKRGQRAAAS